jgi:hypothetical protein
MHCAISRNITAQLFFKSLPLTPASSQYLQSENETFKPLCFFQKSWLSKCLTHKLAIGALKNLEKYEKG